MQLNNTQRVTAFGAALAVVFAYSMSLERRAADRATLILAIAVVAALVIVAYATDDDGSAAPSESSLPTADEGQRAVMGFLQPA